MSPDDASRIADEMVGLSLPQRKSLIRLLIEHEPSGDDYNRGYRDGVLEAQSRIAEGLEEGL